MWVAALNTTQGGRYSYSWVLDPPFGPGDYGVIDGDNYIAARGLAVGAFVVIDSSTVDPLAIAALDRAAAANADGIVPLYSPTIEDRIETLEREVAANVAQIAAMAEILNPQFSVTPSQTLVPTNTLLPKAA